MHPVVFLPGAGGSHDYWSPVARRLSLDSEPILLGWPGFSDTPPDSRIRSLTDLVDYVIERLSGPACIVAQSMGGVVAILLTLRRPDLVLQLVLCGTSGGIDMSRFQPVEWRDDYRSDLPESAPNWFLDDRTDVTTEIPSIACPVLLIWGSEDLISPPAVGHHLESLLPDARLVVVEGAGHMLTEDQPEAIAGHIQRFLSA